MDIKDLLATSLFGIVKQNGINLTNQNRDICNYWDHPIWSHLSQTFTDKNGQVVTPSHYKNIHGENILALQHKHKQALLYDESRGKVYDSRDFWSSLTNKGVDASTNLSGFQHVEAPGMQVIRNMMSCVTRLTDKNKMKLEPFQLKAIRAGICSSSERLLGKDLNKYIPNILHALGLSSTDSADISSYSEVARQQMLKTFKMYSRPIVTVIAPRRNGKSKAGKLLVSVNAACERGAKIVLMAQKLDAILLYKDEVRSYLTQLQTLGIGTYEIHSSQTEIRIDFRDGSSSFIYFVSGGINVSHTQSLIVMRTPSIAIAFVVFMSILYHCVFMSSCIL